MLEKVDLHFRSSPLGEHRNFGLISIEHEGPELEPHQLISCRLGEREIRAHITSISRHGDHLPHVYAETA